MKKIEKRIWSLCLLLVIEIRIDSSKQKNSLYLSLSSLSSLAFSLSFIPREFKKMSESAIVENSVAPTTKQTNATPVDKCESIILSTITNKDKAVDGSVTLTSSEVISLTKATTYLMDVCRVSAKNIEILIKTADANAEAARQNAQAAATSSEIIKASVDTERSTQQQLMQVQKCVSDMSLTQGNNVVMINFLLDSFVKNFFAKFGNPNDTCKPHANRTCKGCFRKGQAPHSTLDVQNTWSSYLFHQNAPKELNTLQILEHIPTPIPGRR